MDMNEDTGDFYIMKGKKLMNLSKINEFSFLGRSLTSEANFNWEIHIDTGKR